MTATAETSPNNHINVNSTGGSHDLAQIVSDIGNTAYVETLESDSGTEVYLMKVPIRIDNDAVVEDNGIILLHTVNSADQAVIFNGAGGGRFTFGVTNPFTETGASDDEPVTSARSGTDASYESPCLYSFVSNNTSQTWCANGPGTWEMHGGMMRWMDNNPDGHNDLYDIQLPDDFVMVQCNCEQWGGGTFEGSYRIQESTFKSSKNGVGFRPSEAGDANRALQDVIFHDNDLVFDLQNYSSNPTFRRIQLRGNTNDWDADGFTGTLTLIDSDNLANPLTGRDFGIGGEILEVTSITPSFVNESGTAITDVRTQAYQTSSGGSTTYGAEQITTYSEFLCNRFTWNESNEATPLDEGSASLRCRRYASFFEDIPYTLGEKPISADIVMRDDTLTVLTEANALLVTGIAIDEANDEVDLTASVTPSEMYDFLHATQAASGNLDIPELFRSDNGFAFNMPAAWILTGQQNLDLSGGEVVVGRYVPITIKSVVNGARCKIVLDSDITTELAEGTASGTEITLTTTFNANPVRIQTRLKGHIPYETITNLSPNGQTLTASMPIDIANPP